MIEKARNFALVAHGDQRYGDRPYSFHLDMVAEYLAPYGTEAQIVGYLHDVVEDTTLTKADIEEEFGGFIAECVGLLTDEPGTNRKERKTKTYAKLAHVTGEFQLALIVKVADRLANVNMCLADSKRALWETYLQEHLVFKKSLYRSDLCEPLWIKLDSLLHEATFELGS